MKQRYLLKRVLASLFFLLLFSTMSFSQQNDASLQGTVKNEKGEALAGVTITVLDKGNSAVATTVTSQAGSFNLPALTIGNAYRLTFSHVGYEAEVITNYQYTGSDVLNLSLQLSHTSEQLNEVI